MTVLASLCLTVLTVSVNLRISREKLALEAKESGMTYALISGVRKIKTTGAEKRAFTRWGELYRKKAELEFDPPTFVKINGTLSMAIGLIGTMAMYFFAVKNNIDPDEYYAFNTAYGMVNSAFGALAGIAVTIANIRPVFEMARPILDSEREVDEERPPVERLSGAVELNNVTFSYTENGPKVLDDLSLKITAGQYVAVVGETGCGKSTLMKLLLGFEQPIRGSVYYDGRDLRTLDVRSVRQKIGVVTQGGKLFAGDIYSNIVISAPMLSLEDAWEAAEMAGMADDIRHMPMGMHTLISEGQGGISGGQKQRLMIARAIAPKPRILMFDEATSALDNITQKKVSESLDRLKCTRIVIAHRLSTIKNCDRIVVMQGGKIVEDGTYEELMQKNGFFAELVKRQIA
ncbi:MAG: ATP-binding cassette domain-containing protein [Lachnospiraceae bacterium]|nr:ATP-binding cassette domain-containing protein [Lachnospiraceae bacterium]